MNPTLKQIIEERITERRLSAQMHAEQHGVYTSAADDALIQSAAATAEADALQAALDALEAELSDAPVD